MQRSWPITFWISYNEFRQKFLCEKRQPTRSPLLRTSRGVQNYQSTSETEKAQNMRETKSPFLQSLASCAQEVLVLPWSACNSKLTAKQPTPAWGLHFTITPRQLTEGCESSLC